MSRSALLLLAFVLAACSGPRAESGSGDAGAALRAAARPSLDLLSPEDRPHLAAALTNRVLVARRLADTGTQSSVDVVRYGSDGWADHRAGNQPATDRFQWSLGSRVTPRGSYAFVARDGAADGAALSFWPERLSVAFSDGRLGPYSSVGIIGECWPRSVAGALPAGAGPCGREAESALLARLDAEFEVVGRLRVAALEGRFSTRVGSVYRNSLGNILTVTAVDGLDVEFRNQQGGVFRSRALLYNRNPRVTGNEKVYAAIASLFPLSAGKKADAWIYDSSGSWQLAWNVSGKERVTVPAGSFDAWRIEHTETSLGGSYVGRATIWYAPSVGWTVKWRGWTQTDSTAPASEWTLVEARPAPTQSLR